jgi:hypothetical protein
MVEIKELKMIYRKVAPKAIVDRLSFRGSMLLAHQFLLNDEMDDDLRSYAVNLIEEIQRNFSKEWEKDWRNELFLGDAYHLLMQHKKRLEAYQRALKRTSSNPHAILVSISGCYLAPDSSVTINQAENLLLEALKKEETIEAVTLLRGIYQTKGDSSNFSYWNDILKRLEENKVYIIDKWPDFLTSSSKLCENDLKALDELLSL